MGTVWKIAPGNKAKDWDLFAANECIGIGWLPHGYDYSDFANRAEILDELKAVYGDEPGCGSGGAGMIWDFVHTVRMGDVVVANNGHTDCVGIGVVTSGYLHPKLKSNPLRKDKTTHRHHVRRVAWIVNHPLFISEGEFFVQRTIARLPKFKCERIIARYRTAMSGDKLQLAKLIELLR